MLLYTPRKNCHGATCLECDCALSFHAHALGCVDSSKLSPEVEPGHETNVIMSACMGQIKFSLKLKIYYYINMNSVDNIHIYICDF